MMKKNLLTSFFHFLLILLHNLTLEISEPIINHMATIFKMFIFGLVNSFLLANMNYDELLLFSWLLTMLGKPLLATISYTWLIISLQLLVFYIEYTILLNFIVILLLLIFVCFLIMFKIYWQNTSIYCILVFF